jgi:hypothetical protein
MINVNAVWMPALADLMIQDLARFMTTRCVMETHIYLFTQN